MNILHFAVRVERHGAGKAALRVHRHLTQAGHASRLVVRHAAAPEPGVIILPARPDLLSRARRRLFPPPAVKPEGHFNNFDETFRLKRDFFKVVPPDWPDVVCLHAVLGLFTSAGIRELADYYRRPVVWMMMDQQPVTGGCYYSLGCDGFTRECGDCPQLARPHAEDVSRRVWRRKVEHLKGLPLIFAGNGWGERMVRASSLFHAHRFVRLSVPVDTDVFRPADRAAARARLGLPPEKKVLFAGAERMGEERKGMRHFVEALSLLADSLDSEPGGLSRDDIHVLMAGNGAEEIVCPFPLTRVGFLKDEADLALAYQAADIFVCPSVEDAGPMMIPEAMLCGTPVVAFEMGGAPDLVRTMETGYLARLADSRDLARGIYELLAGPALAEIGRAALQAALAAHEPTAAVGRWEEFFAELVSDTRGRHAGRRAEAAWSTR
jgi:glycosyltransferase involved in cell wall biosynthesis